MPTMTPEEFAPDLRPCREVVFFTGVDTSTEPGARDFRSPGGMWTKNGPVYFSEFLENPQARIRY